jgi:hypothetical protein
MVRDRIEWEGRDKERHRIAEEILVLRRRSVKNK